MLSLLLFVIAVTAGTGRMDVLMTVEPNECNMAVDVLVDRPGYRRWKSQTVYARGAKVRAIFEHLQKGRYYVEAQLWHFCPGARQPVIVAVLSETREVR